MANSVRGRLTWRISARAEISARFLEQIFFKRRLRLHEETFSPGKRTEKPHVIRMKFQPGLKSEVTWVKK